MLIDIRPRIRKPFTRAVEVDWSHPLAKGLLGGTLLSSGEPQDFVLGFAATLTTSRPSSRVRSGGRGMFFDQGNTQAVTLPMRTASSATVVGMSWATGINVASSGGGTAGRIWSDGVNVNTGPSLQWSVLLTALQLNDERSSASAGCTMTGAPIVANQDCHIVATDDLAVTTSPDCFKVYFNGVSNALVGAGNGSGTVVDPASYALGGLPSVAARSIDGVMYYFYKWGRILSQAEAIWLRDEPYAFLRPHLAITYSFMHGSTAVATVFRKTLSMHGTRTGSRQVHF